MGESRDGKGLMRVWLGRCLLLFVFPAVLFAVVEAGLRMAGYGIDPHFVLRGDVLGEDVLYDNQDIGTLWFAPGLTRSPIPFSSSAVKKGLRIVVLGESAAMGDPVPAFGIAPHLEAILRLRYPDQEVEVINAAMTAIDSSVIVEIARDLAPLMPDAVILYMGNNEVVGPLGPTVGMHGDLRLETWYARTLLWCRSLRTGQLLRNAMQRNQPSASETWQGLATFAGREMLPGSSRLHYVHKRYEDNVAAILDAIRSCGAEPVVGTMATRINWPPFSSVTNNEGSLVAEAHEAKGEWADAFHAYRDLLDKDPLVAEWHYRAARTMLAIGDVDGAIEQFRQSRDLDRLRFRADSQQNSALAARAGASMVVDLERQFNSYWAEPGRFFWDHVHLTPDGNYVAAAAFAGRMEGWLASRGYKSAGAMPSLEEVRTRIVVTDWDRLNMLASMHQRMLRPPLDSISHHREIIGALTAQIASLRKKVTREVVEQIRDDMRSAAQANPRDFHLLGRLGRIYEELGQFREAHDVYETMSRVWPHARSVQHNLGRSLVRAGDLAGGIAHLESGEVPDGNRPAVIARIEASSTVAESGNLTNALSLVDEALVIDPRFAKAWYNRGIIHGQLGRGDEAEADFLKALEYESAMTEACNNLGVAALKAGRTDDAERWFLKALDLQPLMLSALRNMAVVTMQKGDWETALTYSKKLSYLDPELGDISSMQRVPAKMEKTEVEP